MDMEKIHGTCVAVEGTGVLLRGPSGSGKSDLAWRLIDGGARLVADDYTEVRVRDARLYASAPANMAGLIEVRGIGVIRTEHADDVPLGLAFDLVPGGDIERLPEAASWNCQGIHIPLYWLDPFEASAPAKVCLAVAVVQDLMVLVP